MNGNVKRLAVANGPKIFQMLLVYEGTIIASLRSTDFFVLALTNFVQMKSCICKVVFYLVHVAN